jgi:hypothetical protein
MDPRLRGDDVSKGKWRGKAGITETGPLVGNLRQRSEIIKESRRTRKLGISKQRFWPSSSVGETD